MFVENPTWGQCIIPSTSLSAPFGQDRHKGPSLTATYRLLLGTLGKMLPVPCDRLIDGSGKLSSHNRLNGKG